MRARQDEFETHHLTCMVCGALPGTTCIDDELQELPQVHPSRRMTISERNWRSSQGWQPPELIKQYGTRQRREVSRAALFDPRLGPEAKAVLRALRNSG